jgi:hypothetical protein
MGNRAVANAGVAKPGQRRSPEEKPLAKSFAERLSRRGSWVQIPPPAPQSKKKSAQINVNFEFLAKIFGDVGSPGEIRTPVGGSKARYACPLHHRAPKRHTLDG